jgi:AAA+ superfamily predicted ATPase
VIHRGSALSEAVAIPNILIQASAGNGKSSVAKFIASCSEVEYAMISGNNIRALGPRADRVFRNVLDECIRRSKSSRDPFLLVIDDVDAFACLEVENDHKYEPQQAALSYCLHMLLDTFKNNSHRFGLIATSSAPTSALHNALLDRIDCIVQIDSPTFRERLLCILKLMQSLMADYIPEVERKALAILLENSADAIEVVVRNRIKRTEVMFIWILNVRF